MNSLKIILAVVVSIVSARAAEFFPLETGNTWTYRDAVTNTQFTVRVGLPFQISDQIYYQLRGYTPAPVLVRINELKQLVEYDQEMGVEKILTSFEPFDRGMWIAPERECPEQVGLTHEKRVTHEGPAGTFNDVLEVTYKMIGCADVGAASEQYAENIGMLRRVTTTFGGPRTFDLVDARVGKLRLQAALNAQFTVAVTPSPSGDLTVQLRLRTNSPTPLRLQFSSGQEYDLELRDVDGNGVWRLSASQTFIQALHERFVSDEFTINVQIPRAVLPPSGIVPANYTLQGWITTSGQVPLFSATVPVTL